MNRSTVARFLAALSFASMLLFSGLVACQRDESPKVDASLMAYLSKTRALHHEANLREDQGDLPGAISALERILSAEKSRETPEIKEVLADTRARLAELEIKRNNLGKAEDHTVAGLKLAPPQSYFQGHLLEVSGLALEAKSYALADAGDLKGAVSAREEAVKKLEEAILVQEKVILRTLSDGGAP
jgi:hypothetical protein